MNCKECGLEYEVATITSETGDISLHGIHDAGGVDCLTRQLAAKSAECEKLRDLLELREATGNASGTVPYSDFQAALSRAEGKEE